VTEGHLRISVVVIAHERSQYLRQAVDSVLRQTLPRSAFEVVVVKDFQAPELDDFLDRNSVPHFEMETTTTRAGEMFRVGVERSGGDILCFLDDDDRYSPDKLSYILDLFDSRPEVGYIHSRQRFVDVNGAPLPAQPQHAHQGHDARIELKTATDYARASIVCGLTFNNSSIQLRRDILMPWLDAFSRVQVNCDNFLALTAIVSGAGLLCTDRVLCDYRLHGSGSSGVYVGGKQAEYYAGRRQYLEKVLGDAALFLGFIQGSVAEASIRWFHDYNSALYEISDLTSHRGSVARALVRLLGNPHERVLYSRRPLATLSFTATAGAYVVLPQFAKSAYFQAKKMGSARGR
jgi:glycosyltransferase involved in cell wall biosynthesis